jgi:hypothetical protein
MFEALDIEGIRAGRHAHDVEHHVGLDLGQASQVSGLALIETPDGGETCYVRQLRRYPAGVAYPEVAGSVRDLLARSPIAPDSTAPHWYKPGLAVGVTAVGVTVGRLFAMEAASVSYVTLSAGDGAGGGGAHCRVPKREIIGALQAALQQRKLSIASQLPEAEALVEELQSYTVKIRVGVEGDDWRREGGRLDDLVLAHGLAYWKVKDRPLIFGWT